VIPQASPPRQERSRGPADGRLPKLPAAISSFGAAVSDGFLYIYGGHIGKAHAHSRENLADGFWRLNLQRPEAWESLPMGERLQGLALVAWKGGILRIGGVNARNPGNEPTDMHSTAAVARFDPASGAWTELTPLPEPRSSFDAVVVGDRLYVIGGWQLAGNEKSGRWIAHDYVADLTAEPLVWQPLPKAPFQHRALAVAATARRIYAIGGLTSAGESTQQVFVFDPEAQAWSAGPDYPSDASLKGFGVSAFAVGDTVWASGADGRVVSLVEGASEWRDAQHKLASPRFFHRLLPNARGGLMFIAGAAKGGHLDTVETVDLALLNAQPAAALPPAPLGDAPAATGQESWTAFRGDGGSQTTARDLPLRWSDEENLAWSIALPGYGQSSPVIWRDRIFVTSAEGPQKEKLLVHCYDLASGRQLWLRDLANPQPQAVTDYISKAAPTPVVDAAAIYAFFESGDLIALDHAGEALWQRSLSADYGKFAGNHGVGASLAQTGDSVVVLADHDGPSYLLALDKRTGATRWKTDRPARVSWSTPLLTAQNELVVSATGSLEAFDAATGQPRWSYAGLKMNNVPSPTQAADLFIAGSSERDGTAAIRRTTAGAELVWKAEQASCSFGSPLIAGNSVYSVNKAGVAFCNDLGTGALRWSLRLPDSCWASPIASGVSFISSRRMGATTVLRDSPTGAQRVSESKLSITGKVYGVAAVDRAFVVRTGDRLIRLGRE
jgi:outer membrane protein assembly factor BamB